MASNSEHLRFNDTPPSKLHNLVVAYSGWPDAAEGATTAIKYLLRHLGAIKFAEIDPEDFFVFSQERPRTSRTKDGVRHIHWPTNEFYYWNNTESDVSNDGIVFLLGVEPNLKWRTFSSIVANLAKELGVTNVMHLGALLDAVPHTRTIRLTGSATEPKMKKALDHASVGTSTYQGPTGISTAIMEACTQLGMGYASLWAHTSHYLHAAPNYRISLTLARNLARLLKLPIDLSELEIAAETFDREVSKAIEEDNQLREYVYKLESKYDESVISLEMSDPADIVLELEQFLKDRRGFEND